MIFFFFFSIFFEDLVGYWKRICLSWTVLVSWSYLSNLLCSFGQDHMYDVIHVTCRRDRFTINQIPPIRHIKHHLGFPVLWRPQWLEEELIFQHNLYLQMSQLFLSIGSMLTSRTQISRYLLGLVPTTSLFLLFCWIWKITEFGIHVVVGVL